MILFYGEGRLGNQIFQYLALNQVARRDETIIAVGLEDIEATLDLRGPRINVLTRNGWIKRGIKYVLTPLLLRPLARYLRVIGYAYEPATEGPHAGLSGEYKQQRGLFKRVIFVDGGYYQNGELRPAFPVAAVELRADLRAEARRFIQQQVPQGALPIFVHVRRGDYLHFASYGVSELNLPESFYRAGIAAVKQRTQTTHFLFVTDDPQWVTHTFSDIADKSIASFNPQLDFAIMAECQGAVLSNSTFSFAAALLLRDPAIVIGPQYWFGFRVNRWLPPRIRVDDSRIVNLPVLPPVLAKAAGT